MYVIDRLLTFSKI